MSSMLLAKTMQLLSPEHVGALAATAGATILFCVVLWATRDTRAARPTRVVVCWLIALGMIGGAIQKQIYETTTGTWSLRDSLPLHLCDFGLWITSICLVLVAAGYGGPGAERVRPNSRRRRLVQNLYELTYTWGIGGTVQALLTPDVTEGFPHIVWFRYFITHGGIVTGVLVLTFGLGMRVRPESWRRVWLLTLAVAVAVFLINVALDTNYMYLLETPTNPSILDYLNEPPLYQVELILLGTVLLLFWYTPWWVAAAVGKKRTRAG